MSFGDSATTFEESIETATDDELTAGDTCPEGHCERELHELRHARDSQFGTEPHPEAPEVEVVCIHDGVVDSR